MHSDIDRTGLEPTLLKTGKPNHSWTRYIRCVFSSRCRVICTYASDKSGTSSRYPSGHIVIQGIDVSLSKRHAEQLLDGHECNFYN